ncbi:MAG: YggT family protein [Candidatus Peregrinibacteria bacterium]
MDKTQLVAFSIQFITVLGNLISFAIIASILMSWFTMGRPDAKGRFTQMLSDVTEPVINVARKIPHKIGMIDLAPLIALIGVDLLVRLIVYLIIRFFA